MRGGAFALVLATLLLTGCGHKKTRAHIPAPPPPPAKTTPAPPPAAASKPIPKAAPGIEVTKNAKVLYEEVGLASWYGAPYKGRKAADGEVYDENAMTAAHRTLPMHSLVRITNLKTGKSALVRITDRGPFVTGRMIDLSVGAAKAVDLWRMGLAWVRLEVLEAPAAIETGGRWAVQIGAFEDPDHAAELKQRLLRQYQTYKVLQFSGPTGDWVRVRVPGDDKGKAIAVAQNMKTQEALVFLVRLD